MRTSSSHCAGHARHVGHVGHVGHARHVGHVGHVGHAGHAGQFLRILLSWRSWMCGGALEIVPCSRVGHIYRSLNPSLASAGPLASQSREINRGRTAKVWMDRYAGLVPTKGVSADRLNVSSRVALRERLRCHDFDWYLRTVFPQAALPLNLSRLVVARSPIARPASPPGAAIASAAAGAADGADATPTATASAGAATLCLHAEASGTVTLRACTATSTADGPPPVEAAAALLRGTRPLPPQTWVLHADQSIRHGRSARTANLCLAAVAAAQCAPPPAPSPVARPSDDTAAADLRGTTAEAKYGSHHVRNYLLESHRRRSFGS